MSDMKRLLEAVDKAQFAGEKEGQKPGDQWRGDDKKTPGKKLVGEENVFKELDSHVKENAVERRLKTQLAEFKQGVAEDQALDELTGWKQSAPQQKTSAQPKKPTTGELLKKSGDKRSELQRNYDAGKKNWFKEGVAEGKFDPIDDDDYYEYNVNTKEIVNHISGKHPEARKFNPLQREWPGRDEDHKFVLGLKAKYLKPKGDK